ncbi:hypothetical protein [Piscinibacter sakaiensis]|uniref:Uncharacterized protein n=1 Tax=Piscinibacter sakaiensis TaxID=1547922 RepID=A0A0K8NZ38_PISS1|nr:hypothetical protein [Piscinibacter sakaiensis]GAP35180.1 hypothetical protein ISF6_0751 [Piscinibacter sakaiensis]
MTMAAPPDARPVSLHAQDPAVLAWAEAFCRAVGHRAVEAGAPAVPALRPEPAASAEAVAAAATAAPEAGAAAPLGWLIYTPPSWAGLRGGAAALPAWEAAHAPMLRTATLNPALRLVNVLALLHAPEALAAHLLDSPAEALQLGPLTLERGTLGPLAAELAPRGGDPAALQAEALYQSLEAMASLDGEALGLAAAERAAAAAELRDLRQALADAAQERMRRDAEQAAEAEREDRLLKLQLHQMQQELEAQLQAQREVEQRLQAAEQQGAAQAQARDAELAAARAASDEAAREAGLLQGQLRQAQEELALQWQAQRDAVETLLATKEARAAAEAERDQHAQALAELRARPPVDPGLVQRLAASEAEAARLAAEARERAAERDAARQAQAEQAARADRLEAELQPLRDAAAASQQEADLLLSQLHQVQEEFEAVFFKQRDEAQQAQAVAQARDALAKERDALLAERTAWAGERKTLLGERDAARRERDGLATERKTLLAERTAWTADREKLARELAQRRAEAEAQRAQLDGQVQQLAQEIEQQRIDRALAASAADERLQQAERQREALQRDGEGLLQQVQQLREELELYYRRHRSLQEAEEARRHQLRRLQAHAHALQPDTLRIDLRSAIDGDGWHEAEPDGRWTGPATSSRLHLPGLAAGAYHVQLEVVDALAPDVLDGAALAIAGVPVRLEALEPGLPARLMGLVELPDDGALEWELRLDTPRVLTPRETSGLPDDRLLGLRVRSLALTRLA